MLNKERKQLKHSLKTNIDSADTWIKLALVGSEVENSAEERGSSETKKTIISKLTELKNSIKNDSEKFIAEIDEVISKFSKSF